MLPINLGAESLHNIDASKTLDTGVPTISAYAELCRRAIISPPEATDPEQLSLESQAILVCGAQRGVVDVRSFKDDYDSVQRFLAVCVEVEPDSHRLFLQKDDPVQTVAFLEGFAQLCRCGLIVHHLGRDFSFSSSGYALAKQLTDQGKPEALVQQLEFATTLDH